MLPSDLIKWFIVLFVTVPVLAAIVAFQGPLLLRPIARWVLLGAWLAHAAATFACLKYAFAEPSSGIGSGVFLLVAIPVSFFAVLWFGIWRGARRHAYVQSLPPPERRYEELQDIERALEATTKNLQQAQRKVDSWSVSSEESARLRFEIDLLKSSIAHLKQERAKRTG
jgi:hypothetical protein